MNVEMQEILKKKKKGILDNPNSCCDVGKGIITRVNKGEKDGVEFLDFQRHKLNCYVCQNAWKEAGRREE